jgi:alpha-mannosidase
MRIFRFWLNAGKATQAINSIDRQALAQNEKPFVLPFFPQGGGKKPKPLAILSDNVTQITAIKKATNNNNLIVRLFEPTGKKRSTVLSLPFVGKKIKLHLNPFEIKTLKINPNSGSHKEVNLLEK